MDNVFKTPDSNLTNGIVDTKKPHIMWKVFFWLYSPLILVSILLLLIANINLNTLDYIDLVIFSITVVGLFGYTFSIKLGSRTIWKIMFILLPIWAIFYEVVFPFIFKIPQYGEPAELDIWLLFNIIYIPLFIYLYLYSFKSEHLWAPKEKPGTDHGF